MKKLLVLLTLLVAVFGFSAGAFAQVLPTIETCAVPNGRIPCVVTGQTGTGCDPFNFQDATGYCPTKKPVQNKAVFIICNCPDSATNFRIGSTIGVRLTILVNGLSGERGAYWAGPSTGNIRLGEYATLADACAATAYTSSFGPGAFYKASDLTDAGKITPFSGVTCAVPSANRATVIVTDRTAGYTITSADEINALSRWWIEIPSIRIDSTILHSGEIISVKIELLNQNVGRGICADCPPICEGTVVVATVCCGETSSCFFPYFTSTAAATDMQPYWNGIAIVNTSSGAGTATLTVHQQDGKTGTYTTPSIAGGSMYVSALENIPFVGSGLGDVPFYVSVTTTFSGIDGFAMIANSLTGESMGYLCRK